MSFSQHGEDDLIIDLVPETGRFLDIGAYRPKELSNTRLLYERGWGGLMVEPSPGPMRHLIDAYGKDSRVTLLQAMIGPSRSVVQFDVTDGPVSTGNAGVRRLWATDGNYVGRIYVPMVTIEDVISQFGPFHFVNIDAEGGSMGIFDRLMHTSMYPNCICVEHDGEEVTMDRMAAEHGYRRAATNETNSIFYR